MSNTIQKSPEYISATATLQSLLFPTQVSKNSHKPTTLAERTEAIPTNTALLIARNSRDGLEKFLNKELGHFVTVRKIEGEVVKQMATFLVATESDIRNKLVIPNTFLSTQISDINTIMAKARVYLNTTAFEFSRLDKQTGWFSSWLPDPSCTYFETALKKFVETQVKPKTISVKSIPAQKKEKAIAPTSSKEGTMKKDDSTESPLTEDSELTSNPSPTRSPRESIDLEERPQIAGQQERAEGLTLSSEAAAPSLQTTVSGADPELSKNLKNVDIEPSVDANASTHTATAQTDIRLSNEEEEPETSSETISQNSEESASSVMTPHDNASAEESASNGSVSPKAESISRDLDPSSSDESINPETPPTPMGQPTLQPSQLQLPRVASSSQIIAQSDATKPKNQTKNHARASQELPPSKDAKPSSESQEQKKNQQGGEPTLHRRTSAAAAKR